MKEEKGRSFGFVLFLLSNSIIFPFHRIQNSESVKNGLVRNCGVVFLRQIIEIYAEVLIRGFLQLFSEQIGVNFHHARRSARRETFFADALEKLRA